nr:MAG TPA: hypothetical protein [Caudoviricetes sp.]DAQ57205.1 MAG TPA: hypothetical protein [Caudoviricetes sp.]
MYTSPYTRPKIKPLIGLLRPLHPSVRQLQE